jgi:hypothetical protein
MRCWLLAMLLGACVTEVAPGDTIDDTTLATADSYHGFAQINAQPYTSSIGAFDINLYVNDATDAYARIHPETSGSNATMPVGTVIVREVLDGSGAVSKLTIMAKQPPGFDSTLGDWWFGEADPDGTPRQLGRLTECHGCHLPRAHDDFLFGVPAADEAKR